MNAPSDRDLMDRARARDPHAFGELVRRFQPRVHRLALHLVRDHADAEDVAQETFIRAYRAMDRFDGRSEPFTWIYRIAVNLSLNVLRARKSARVRNDAGDPRLEEIGERTAGSGPNPDEQAIDRQYFQALAEGIDGLSESLRTTLILVLVDGVSHEDASAVLGAPVGTIAWRVHEARRKLKEFLKTRGIDSDA